MFNQSQHEAMVTLLRRVVLALLVYAGFDAVARAQTPVYAKIVVTAETAVLGTSTTAIPFHIVYYKMGEALFTDSSGSVLPGQTVTMNLQWNIEDYDFVEIQTVNYGTKVGQSFIGTGGGGFYPVGQVAYEYNASNRPTNTFTLQSASPLSDGRKTVWLGTDETLTASLFREGVDKIIAQSGKTPGATGDGGAGSMPNTELVNTAAKEANLLTDFTDLTPNVSKSGMESAGAAAGSDFAAIIGTVPTGLGYSLSPGGQPNLSVAMPEMFGGGVFDFNPFTSDRLLGVTSWFRTAVAWLVLVTLGVWVWSAMSEWVRGFSTIRQAHGNPIIAGTGAQATALAAAGMMTVAIVVAITALVAWTFGDINVPAMVAAVTTNPVATIPAGVLWMLDQVFPVATMISSLVARLTFNMYGSIVFGVCSSVIRFIVP